jgi:RNA polymerase sigma factor (sigma-70 family)
MGNGKRKMESITQDELAQEQALILLWPKAFQGSEAHIVQILELLTPEVKAMVNSRRSCIHQADIEDAVQEATIAILRCIDRYDPEVGPFLFYVRRSIRQKIKTCVGVNRLPRIEEEPTYEMDDTPVLAQDLLSSLPRPRRQMVESFFGINTREKTINQIAAFHDKHHSQVKKELQESITQLRNAR